MLHHPGDGPRPRDLRRARALVAAGVCVASLVALCGCARSQAAASPTGGGLSVSYETPGSGPDERAFLHDRELPEQVAADLNSTLRPLPEPVRITGRSCEKDGVPEYDPRSSRIVLCYGFVQEVRSMFRTAARGGDGRAQDVDERTAGVVTETLYHEAAHALIDKLDLAFTGHEEDVADQFAAYRLIARGASGRAALLAAADNYAQYAEDEDREDADPSDEHAPDAARSANYRCYLYGADPQRYANLVDGKRLSKERAGLCQEEYRALRRGWSRLLAARPSGGPV
ncbi:DUF4344 domain-containing metallopeptidase [Streptomyces sp. NPDC049577]|uniref:DUF4344 domain-containing metallopeptidase n=1 Tax=Streptomyces sp. NPDC049577 TaxID=3155153 RepID=UPI003421E333